MASYKTALRRSATSLYTTPEAAMEEPSILQCQICLDTFVNAVALEPCGHSFCAACLSQYLAACLGHGQALACPLRCAAPQRVVINHAIRQLLASLQNNQAVTAVAAAANDSSGTTAPGGLMTKLPRSQLDATPEDESIPASPFQEQDIISHPLERSYGSSLDAEATDEATHSGDMDTSQDTIGPHRRHEDVANADSFEESLQGELINRRNDVRASTNNVDNMNDIEIDNASTSASGTAYDSTSARESEDRFTIELESSLDGNDEDEDEEEESIEEESIEDDGMHPSVPLDDSHLPLALHTLKDDQLAFTLSSLALFSSVSELDYATIDPGTVAAGLELIARLTWSDEVARGTLGSRGGVETVIDCMRAWMHSEMVLCSGCLAIMALVRGEGPGSSANRWQLGVCGGLEILLEIMQRHKDQSMVQLSALLCLVPLALEGPFFQQEISRQGVTIILEAARRHSDCEEVVAKALLAAGALAQGVGPEADAAADRLVAGGVVEIVVGVLKQYRGGNEDVLWAALFVLAVLARDNEEGVERTGYVERMLYMARSGVLTPLVAAAQEYRNSDGRSGLEEDETILMAAEYLEEALVRATALLWLKRVRVFTNLACLGMSVWMAFKCYRRIKIGPSKI